jgi:methionyl aminopeptidase
MIEIKTKTPEEIKIMAEGGKILAKIMKGLGNKVKPGITTQDLDRAAEDLVLTSGGRCSFKDYHGYPSCLCASINEEIVHAVPSERALKDGDIVSLDLGIKYRGFHADMAVTVPVTMTRNSAYAENVVRLLETTKEALEIGLKQIRPGGRFGDISRAIQKYVEGQGFSVIRELCGHGIGKELHEDPEILNYGKRGTGPEIAEGMVFCLEPMVSAGDWHIKKSKDGFGYQTQDGSLSAHFEHTIVVTPTGCQVLTKI